MEPSALSVAQAGKSGPSKTMDPSGSGAPSTVGAATVAVPSCRTGTGSPYAGLVDVAKLGATRAMTVVSAVEPSGKVAVTTTG